MRKVEVSMRKMRKKQKKGKIKTQEGIAKKSLKGEIFQTNFYYGGTYYEKDLLQKSGRLNDVFALNERNTQSISKLM